MTLYEINRNIEDILNRMFEEVDEETGEVNPEIVTELAELNEARDTKIDNIGAYIKNLDAEAKAIKDEMDALKKRLDQKKKTIDRLKEYVAQDLLAHGETKKESPRVVFSFRKSVAVEITDETLLPKDLIVTTVETKPDKTKIKECLKEEQEVPGAVLVERMNIQIK